jgi:Na+-transporting methylmalonyl-CoA/oxaloacetate decarboxylase gamma subunit
MDWNFSWETVSQGLQVAAYGLAGVFIVLILFYFITKLMMLTSKKAVNSRKN